MAENRAQRDKPLRALILTDGKMGDLAQCRGVADALPASATEITIKPSAITRLLGIATGDEAFKNDVAALEEAPDLVIASGRRTVPFLRLAPRLLKNRPLTVFLKDPRTGKSTADIIWVPAHDRLRGDNVVVTDTAPHGHTSERQKEAAEHLKRRLVGIDLTRPWLGVFLGGRTSKVAYDQQTVDRLAGALKEAAKTAGSVLVTPSRRTPPDLVSALEGIHPNIWIWDGNGDNPYAGMLGACDAFLVTGDSHNMVSEVLSTGRHVMVFRPEGLPRKFHHFLDRMDQLQLITDPQPARFDHHQDAIDATPEIAAAIRSKLQNRAD